MDILVTTSKAVMNPMVEFQSEKLDDPPFTVYELEDCEECGGRGYDLGGLNPTEYDPCPKCGGAQKEHVLRDYLGEAFLIIQGKSAMVTERKHLIAVVAYARRFVTAAMEMPEIAA